MPRVRLEPPLERVQAALADRPAIVLAYLFGSAARGTLSPDIDLDGARTARSGR